MRRRPDRNIGRDRDPGPKAGRLADDQDVDGVNRGKSMELDEDPGLARGSRCRNTLKTARTQRTRGQEHPAQRRAPWRTTCSGTTSWSISIRTGNGSFDSGWRIDGRTCWRCTSSAHMERGGPADRYFQHSGGGLLSRMRFSPSSTLWAL